MELSTQSNQAIYAMLEPWLGPMNKGTAPDHIAELAEVVPKALELAAGLADKAHPIMRKLKSDMYPRALEALALPMAKLPAPEG